MLLRNSIPLTFILLASTASIAVANTEPELHLDNPELTCEGAKAHITLHWKTASNTAVSISRISSWRDGWDTIETAYISNTYVDTPQYMRPQTYVYQIAAKVDNKRIASNKVRVNLSSCFHTEPVSIVSFNDPEVQFPKDVPTGLWGASVGYLAEDGTNFEELVGEKMTARTATVYWGNENDFPAHLREAFEEKVMILFWNPGDYTSEEVNDARFSYDAILDGIWDDYIASFAAQIKEYQKPVILVPFRDMNGNWFPWSGSVNGNSAEKHIAAYRYIHGFFENADNVYFGWSVTNQSVPDIGTNSMIGYYPGNTYVDVVGVSGYNYGKPWQTFHDVFAPTLFDFKIFQKPVMIFGMGSTEGEQKSSWITEAITLQIPQYAEIIGWLWDNVPYDERHNWRVDSSAESLEAFRKALKH